MMKPTKAQARDRIQRAIDAIQALKTMSRSSQEFTKWHRNTEIAIAYTFGENSRHIETFKKIQYVLMAFTTGTPDYQCHRAYVSGL